MKLRELPPRTMIVKAPMKHSRRVMVPDVRDAVASKRTVADFYETVRNHDRFSVTIADASREIEARRLKVKTLARSGITHRGDHLQRLDI